MSKEIKVALFIIASVLIAVFGSNFLMSKGIFSSSNTYYVVFDNTEGLYKSNLIVINGIQVGKVADMQLIKEGKNVDKILVTLDINDDIKIPTGSKAILGAEGTGLMGDMMVKIKKNNKSTEFLKEGDYLEKGVEIGLIDDLSGKFGPVGDNLNVTLKNINKLFDFEKENKQSLNYTIENLNKILDTYNKTGNALNAKIADLLDILSSSERLMAVIKTELLEIKEHRLQAGSNLVVIIQMWLNALVNRSWNIRNECIRCVTQAGVVMPMKL